MAALPQYLVSQNLEQPRPKVVPKRNAVQATIVQDGIRVGKVEIRPRERRAKQLLLGTINDPGFRVTRAIPVNLDVRGKTVVAIWKEVDEFGTGRSTTLACDDLGRTLAELYVSLKADEANLGPDLLRVWDVLKQHVAERSR